MKQNIYDTSRFFEGYKQYRRNDDGGNERLEQPAMRSLLPDLAGKHLLELACGMGSFAKWCAEAGAERVIGTDISTNMIEHAKVHNAHPHLDYCVGAVEDLEFEEESFDVITSGMALHYVSDYPALLSRIARWLKPGGLLVFSTEHPLLSAAKEKRGWAIGDDGQKLFWPVDNYGEEGVRHEDWFVDGVVKYHRMFSTLTNELIDCGFQIERVLEGIPTAEQIAAAPALEDHLRRPIYLLFKARKTDF